MLKSKVKYIQTLGQKKFRESEGMFIAEGPKLVADLIASVPSKIREIYAVKEWIDTMTSPEFRERSSEIAGHELEKISQLSTPNSVLAIVEQFDNNPALVTKNMFTLVLDTIQDPGNLGTILRTADWFGVTQVVCSLECADRYNPKVVQSTMGSIARVQVLYTGLSEWLTAQDVRIFAATLEGESVMKMEPVTEGILIMGNESKGISPGILAHAGTKITIPGKGKAESLNAAVATGIMLSQLT